MPSPRKPQHDPTSGRNRSARRKWIAAVAMLTVSIPVPAETIGLSSGMNADGKLQSGSLVLKDEPFFIFSDPIANLNTGPKVEVFVKTASQTFTNQKVFAAGLAEVTGNVEVGVGGFWKGSMEAADRFVLSVQNEYEFHRRTAVSFHNSRRRDLVLYLRSS